MNRILVAGAGGFIGSHLVRRLKSEGFWVRGVDLKYPESRLRSVVAALRPGSASGLAEQAGGYTDAVAHQGLLRTPIEG